jgi:hypothetical protein
MEDDLDLILGEEETGGDWFCEACEYGPMDEEEGRCGRCNHKHKHHKDEEMELDENGDPVDEKYYEEHY